MNVEQWDIDQLKPYEHNPRINEDAVDAVEMSLRMYGFRQPIVVDQHGTIDSLVFDHLVDNVIQVDIHPFPLHAPHRRGDGCC